jgi:hypothetical protein
MIMEQDKKLKTFIKTTIREFLNEQNFMDISNDDIQNGYDEQTKDVLSRYGNEYVVFDMDNGKFIMYMNGKYKHTDNINWITTYEKEIDAYRIQSRVEKLFKTEIVVLELKEAIKYLKK